jgi:hypothetical protein
MRIKVAKRIHAAGSRGEPTGSGEGAADRVGRQFSRPGSPITLSASPFDLSPKAGEVYVDDIARPTLYLILHRSSSPSPGF